ncbi:gephyrin-like molybdotransferase Glp [Corynebacterium aquatimens]|uniref:Molybdopterin molybdenumtransferase n=1 Tax=Corynebacterium aquatimens TaxID=1190508 RepID=A0A931E0I2_9CORY|nr:gephyrin-like molybdotransferase Glp [Corynebacterium aquatimens]MBG6121136.1 molybdopterin molybdotransferase [Corynebacterium aquatimens]WJY66309.1 Molybdopterin molybdenumtransferase [Corynebacterium aquatimens]
MRSVDEQLAMVIDATPTPEPIRVGITDALGLMCAEEVAATTALPGFTQAAVDGYAVRAVDVGGTRGISPIDDRDSDEDPRAEHERSLPVLGEVAAGSQKPLRLQPRQAVRVATGAPLPTLADAVLPLEWSDRGRKRVSAYRPVRSGDFVRKPGDDISPGDLAVRAGTVLGPAQIGLLAATGKEKVLVYPRPRVTVMSYGLELVDIERTPGLGQVYDVNSYALAAAAKDAGADVTRVGIVNAEPRKLKEQIAYHASRSEILVITGAVGGSSAKPIQEALGELGEIDTTRVAMHPGSAQGFGLIGPERVPTFLLPPNPVSALVIFETLIRPSIRTALSKRVPTRRVVKARSLGPIESIAGRVGYLRARLMRDAHTRDYLVESIGGVGGAPAHLLAGLAEANAMIRIPEDVTDIRPGDEVDVIFLQQRA